MTKKEDVKKEIIGNKENLVKASFLTNRVVEYENPWVYKEGYNVDVNDPDDYRQMIDDSRFFYRKDALASTTINKLVDIAINELTIVKNGLSENEFRVFEGLNHLLLEFSEKMALEFLISGLVIPEISFARLNKEEMNQMGIYAKKYEAMFLPKSLWLRNPSTVRIRESLLTDSPSYFVAIPGELIFFITSEGTYSDGTKDEKLYMEMLEQYPEFVTAVREGKTEIELEDVSKVIRRKVLTDGPYPTPYLMPALDPLKHKRTLRRMDYSVATKVLSAILHVKIGSDDFPMTDSEEDEGRLTAMKNQLLWRNVYTDKIENIFQFFTDHTVELNWIFPDTEALLNESKYKDINEDIIFALGFPRTLIVGESERTGTSNPEYASMSPVKTMENFRDKILTVLRYIVEEVAKGNKFKSVPEITFAPINLHDFRTFTEGLDKLFQSGSLSREDYAKPFGFSFSDQLEKRIAEQKELEKSKIPEFGASPFQGKTDKTGKNGADTGEDSGTETDPEVDKSSKNKSKK